MSKDFVGSVSGFQRGFCCKIEAQPWCCQADTASELCLGGCGMLGCPQWCWAPLVPPLGQGSTPGGAWRPGEEDFPYMWWMVMLDFSEEENVGGQIILGKKTHTILFYWQIFKLLSRN